MEWAQRWIRQEGLEDLAEVRLMDYRDVPEGDFDGICSLGMMEHVGYKHYPAYFQEIYNKLKPGAMLLNQVLSGFTHRNWWIWMLLCSKLYAQPAMYRPHRRAFGSPTIAVAWFQWAERFSFHRCSVSA